MLKKHSQFVLGFLFFSDMLITVGSWLFAYFLRFRLQIIPINPAKGVAPLHQYVLALPVILVVCAICFRYVRMYLPRRYTSFFAEFADVAKGHVFAAVVLSALTFFYKNMPSFSAAAGVIFVAVNCVAVFSARLVIREILRGMRRKGRNLRYVLVVGAGKLGQQLVQKIQKNPWTGFSVVGYIDEAGERVGKSFLDVPVLGKPEDLPRLIKEEGVDHVFIALPVREYGALQDIMKILSRETVDLRIVPDFFSFQTLNTAIDDFEGLPVVSIRESPLYGWNMMLKRIIDIAFSAAAIILLAIPMMLIAVIIKLTGKGPVFYLQERAGLDGKKFRMIKFRSMRVDAERSTGAVWASEGDPRRTRFGAFLRKTSLDELPQFFNVFVGQMSIVGPRPERPVFIEEFKQDVPKYMFRHKMKAGITGWAQVNGWRGDTSLDKRIQYDLYYIEHWSIWFDFKIMFLTAFKGLVSRHAY